MLQPPQPHNAADPSPMAPPLDPIASLRAALRGHYDIERQIGQGAFATVYLAHDLKHERRVALKVLLADPTSELGELRFIREIRMLARLQHPNILPLHDSGHVEALLYYVMPYVSGDTLRDRIDRERQLPLDIACSISRDVADALAYAHGQGIIHRDIKPENILLSAGHPVLADFGIARAIDLAGVRQLTRTGMGSPGTPAYMSPEQLMGDKELDGRSDTYSLGCVFFEMLTGKTPFTGKEGFVNRFTEPPPKAASIRNDVPAWVDDVIATSLARNPNDRYQTAHELVTALSAADNATYESRSRHRPPTAPTHYVPGLRAEHAGLRKGAPERDRLAPQPLEAVSDKVAALDQEAAKGTWLPLQRRSNPVVAATRRLLLPVAILVAALAFAVRVLPAGWRERFPGFAGTGQIKSIAVLPFSGTADSTEEYFRDGMAEQLIVNLSSVPGLAVASRTSAFTYKDRNNVSAADIGRALRVDNILEGSVRRDGRKMRVFVQLTDPKDGKGLWSETFEASNADVFAMQDSIAHAILDKLRVRLAGGAPRQLSNTGTANLAAYDLYLRARHEFNKFEEAPLRQSIKLYNQAIELDPRYPQAWAGIAESWSYLADDYVAPSIAYPAAKQAAEQALGYDATLAAAHAALGTALYSFEWNFADGRRETNTALSLDPHSFLAQVALQGLFLASGKPDSALAVLKAAQASDPLSVLNALVLGRFYEIVGRPQESIDEYQRAIQLAPSMAPVAMVAIGEALIVQGRIAEADSIFGQARKMLGPDMEFMLASGEAARGHRAEALRLVTKLEARSRVTYVRPELIAAVYVRLGDRDKAFDWLNKAYEARSPYLLALKVDRQWNPIRDDPRFAALVRKIGLP
jgi:eukaryotic-like serine/threonine-protein kinase